MGANWWRILILVMTFLSLKGMAQTYPQYTVQDPQNIDCLHAIPLEYSMDFNYSGSTHNGCCLWFYVQIPSNATPGFQFTYSSTNGGAFSVFMSAYFQPCDSIGDCANLPIDEDGEWDEDFPPQGYRYIVFHGSDTSCAAGTLQFRFVRTITSPSSICEECIPSFTPELNTSYIIDAWAKVEDAPLSTVNYTDPYLSLRNLDYSSAIISSTEVEPSGPIIDGWQRMEGTFTMDASAAKFQIFFGTHGGPVYFDDVRIFPADGSMKCYVYDPINLRFVAELDERHFATYYEYDNEGKIVRVKKETERGVETLKETRENAHHVLP
jgi:hypothetical protein